MKNRYVQKGIYAAVFTMVAVQTQAASSVDFSNLVEQVSPAVVSVNVVKKMTQEELAIKAGTKKSYISKIENAKGNIQLSTLMRIFEKGLNRKIGLTFL